MTETERELLGRLLLDGDKFADLANRVSAADFTDDLGASTFRAIQQAVLAGEDVSPTSIANTMRDAGVIQPREWSDVVELATQCIGAGQVVTHADEVREYAKRRRIRDACRDVLNGWATTDSTDLAAQMSRAVQNLGDEAADTVLMSDAVDSAVSWVKRAEAERSAGRAVGIPTGLAAVDKFTGGFMPGELVCVAARTSVGKTAFLNSIAIAAGRAGKRGLVISLEETPESIAMRAMSAVGDYNMGRLRLGLERAEAVRDRIDKTDLAGLPVWINTKSSDLSQILNNIAVLKRKHGIQWAMVDHLGLVRVDTGKKVQRYEQVGEVTSSLKGLAQRLEIPIIVAAQLNRDAVKERPALHNLRESGNIEQDINVGIFLHRPNPNPIPGQPIDIEVGVLKSRYGMSGWLPENFKFDGSKQKFEEAA